MTPEEQSDLSRIRASLYDWYFCDIKKAATVGLPRLAFVGLACWIDAVARLAAGKKGNGQSAWRAFIQSYLPTSMHAEADVVRLRNGLRDAMSHEYGTRNIALTHNHPEHHWLLSDEGIRVLNLESLIEDFERAFEKFFAQLESDGQLRAKVLPQSKGLLVPRPLHMTQPVDLVAASATSVSSSVTVVRLS